MARIQTISLTGLLIAFLATPALATGLGLGGHYSYVQNQDTDDETNMLGVQVRLRGRVVGLEGRIDYRNDDLGDNLELKTWPISASLLIYPFPSVYGLAGLGWYNSTLDFADETPFDDQTSTDLGYHFGAGLEAPISQTLSLTGDVRWLFVDYEFDDIPSSIGNVDSDSFAINVGFLIYFR